MKDQTIVTFKESFTVFNIREDIKYGDIHDIILALGIHYFYAHEARLNVGSLNDFFGIKLKSDLGMIVMRTAIKNRVRFPIMWNDIAVEALRVLMDFIHYETVVNNLVIFEN